MRVRTITCHDCYNAGASLQAFALQHFIESLGHDVKIIDYKPDYLSRDHNFLAVNNSKFDKPIIKQVYLLAKLPRRLMMFKRKSVFDKFTKRYLHLTRRYTTYNDLKDDAPSADVYIAGSDQIWNTLLRNGRDKAFYLDFGPSEVKRISYAASFASSTIVPEYIDFIKGELKLFDACSIRERTHIPLLQSLGRTDGVAVCDPVLLLSREEWNNFLLDNKRTTQPFEKYILVYHTEKNERIENIALTISKITGWKIYVIGSFKERYADRNLFNSGPIEFISLIKNAQFVISNSFHATIFSIIYEKKFCVVARTESINERMRSVLADLELDERLTDSFNKRLLNEIDYSRIRINIEDTVIKSKEWLKMRLLK